MSKGKTKNVKRNRGQRRASFAALVFEERRRGTVEEVLQLYGDMPECSAKDAIDIDWLHVLVSKVADVTETLRNTVPEDEAFSRRMMRKHLAGIVATCEAWERHV